MLPETGARRRHKRTPKKRRTSVARGGGLSVARESDAAQLVADMQRAGALLRIQANADRNDFRYVLRFKDGADVERCRALAANAKAEPDLLALFRVAVFVAIARDEWSLPVRPE